MIRSAGLSSKRVISVMGQSLTGRVKLLSLILAVQC
jgi:hypothetical protein